MSINIIFGEEAAEKAKEYLVVLEVDSKKDKHDNLIRCYCVIDPAALSDMSSDELNRLTGLHSAFIEEYKKQNLSFCQEASTHLTGKWNGTLDDFYTHAIQRLSK